MKPELVVPKVIFKEIKSETDLPKQFNRQFHTHLLCTQGGLKFKLNHEPFQCKAGDFLFWFSESNLSNLQFSKHFKAWVLLVETNFLNNNVPDQNWSINAVLYSRKYPVKYLNDEQSRNKILMNFERLYQHFLEEHHTFYEEKLKLQMRIFILEMWHIFSELYEYHKYSLQTGSLYERFTNFLNSIVCRGVK